MKGKVMTVQGLIDPDELGITFVHEHLVLDAAVWWKEPAEASKKKTALSPLDIRHLGTLRCDPTLPMRILTIC